jgi:hypothetical protein
MSTPKNGYYTDGYFVNGSSRALPSAGFLAKPIDDPTFVYQYKLGIAISKFTGVVSGAKHSTVNLAYYVNGSPATGVVDNVYYVNGSKGSGCPTNPDQFCASPNDVLYKNGVRYTGLICRDETATQLPLRFPNRSTVVSGITSNWIGYWPNGDATIMHVPKTYDDVITVPKIAASTDNDFCLAVTNTGTLTGWGRTYNAYYSSTLREQTRSLSGITSVAIGYQHSVLALTNTQRVIGFGDNTQGQLDIPPSLSGVVAIKAKYGVCYAITNTGLLTGWGSPITTSNNLRSLSGVVDVAIGVNHTLVLTNNGTLTSWGSSSFSSYGLSIPPSLSSGVIAIAADRFHSIALKNDGTVVQWGYLPQMSATDVSTLSGIVAIDTGFEYGVALTNTGRVTAWGNNTSGGYSGQITGIDSVSGVTAIAAGDWTIVTLDNKGTVKQLNPQATGHYLNLFPHSLNKNGSMLTKSIGSSLYLQPYWDVAQAPNTLMLQMSSGVLANGLLNNKKYSNGVLLTADTIDGGRLFRKGSFFGGTLNVSNSAVTWNGQTINIASSLIASSAVPLTGVKTFSNGVLSQGAMGNTFFINGTKYEALETTTLGISGLTTQNIYYHKGVVANGNINGINFVNGVIKS